MLYAQEVMQPITTVQRETAPTRETAITALQGTIATTPIHHQEAAHQHAAAHLPIVHHHAAAAVAALAEEDPAAEAEALAVAVEAAVEDNTYKSPCYL